MPYARSEGSYSGAAARTASDAGLFEALLWIGGAIAAYFLLQKASGVVSSITAPLVNSAADAYVAMTAGGAAIPSGNIVLPNGTAVPVAQLTPTINSSGDTTINYGGATYTVLPGTDDDGNWQAVE